MEINENAGNFTLSAVDMLANFNDDLVITGVVQSAGRGVNAIINRDGSINFDRNLFNDLADGESETVTFTYNVTDGTIGAATSTTITITGTDDAPVVSAATSGVDDVEWLRVGEYVD